MSATITTIAPAQQPARALDSAVRSEKWSARRTAAFVIVVCGVFWLAAAGLVTLAVRAL